MLILIYVLNDGLVYNKNHKYLGFAWVYSFALEACKREKEKDNLSPFENRSHTQKYCCMG